jgi:hypothetical protein
MSKKSKLTQLKKVNNRKEFLDEYWDFFQFELWDKDLVEDLLYLPIDDEELFDLCETVEDSLSFAWKEGYDEATDSINAMLKGKHKSRPTYASRRAVVESDND